MSLFWQASLVEDSFDYVYVEMVYLPLFGSLRMFYFKLYIYQDMSFWESDRWYIYLNRILILETLKLQMILSRNFNKYYFELRVSLKIAYLLFIKLGH